MHIFTSMFFLNFITQVHQLYPKSSPYCDINYFLFADRLIPFWTFGARLLSFTMSTNVSIALSKFHPTLRPPVNHDEVCRYAPCFITPHLFMISLTIVNYIVVPSILGSDRKIHAFTKSFHYLFAPIADPWPTLRQSILLVFCLGIHCLVRW